MKHVKNTMKLKIPQDYKNDGMLPQISFKKNPVIRNNLNENQDSLKIEINTQLSEANSGTVLIYVTIFKTGPTEALLKLRVLPNKIRKGQNINTLSYNYSMTNNLLVRDPLWVFKNKYQEKFNEAAPN